MVLEALCASPPFGGPSCGSSPDGKYINLRGMTVSEQGAWRILQNWGQITSHLRKGASQSIVATTDANTDSALFLSGGHQQFVTQLQSKAAGTGLFIPSAANGNAGFVYNSIVVTEEQQKNCGHLVSSVCLSANSLGIHSQHMRHQLGPGL